MFDIYLYISIISILVFEGDQSVEYDDVEGERDGDGGKELFH